MGENQKLKEDFEIYELVNQIIVTIVYACTLVLIVPFVGIYTQGIHDVNYVRPIFACVFVIAEFFYMLRNPYNIIISTSGHFKETKTGAWIESLINIVFSVVLISRYGMIGVAIGTLIAMMYRTIDLFLYSDRVILKRSISKSFRIILISVCELVLVYAISVLIPIENVTTYVGWIKYGIFTFCISFVVVFGMSWLLYRHDITRMYEIIKNILKRNKKK